MVFGIRKLSLAYSEHFGDSSGLLTVVVKLAFEDMFFDLMMLAKLLKGQSGRSFVFRDFKFLSLRRCCRETQARPGKPRPKFYAWEPLSIPEYCTVCNLFSDPPSFHRTGEIQRTVRVA